MKIIDNKKDYYDYLMGVIGQDEQVVYDRRGSQMVNLGCYERDYPNWKFGHPYLTYILWIGKEYRVISFDKKTNRWVCGGLEKTDKYIKPIPRKTDKPIELIILSGNNKYWHNNRELVRVGNPILRDIAIICRHISPEFIWNNIYDYLCSLKEQVYIDTRTDVQKAESHGFDKKTSFRNIK